MAAQHRDDFLEVSGSLPRSLPRAAVVVCALCGALGRGGGLCENAMCSVAGGGLQSTVQPDFGRGCGEDCRGAAEEHDDFLVVSGSPPRVACCGVLCVMC